MKMNKKLGVAALALFISAASYAPVNAQETAETVNVTTHAEGGNWHFTDGVWTYTVNGIKQTGWLDLGGTWYYLNASGEMVTGWLDLGGTWYYLDANGVMSTGWLDLGGTWYYLDESGMMATSWLNLGGTWYYLDASGVMSTGWLDLGSTWYYLDATGKMLTNTTVGNWEIDSNGIATEIIFEEEDDGEIDSVLSHLDSIVFDISRYNKTDFSNWDELNLDGLLAEADDYLGENPVKPNPSYSEIDNLNNALIEAFDNLIILELTQENIIKLTNALAFAEKDYLAGTAEGVDPEDIFVDVDAWYNLKNSYEYITNILDGKETTFNSLVDYSVAILETPLARK